MMKGGCGTLDEVHMVNWNEKVGVAQWDHVTSNDSLVELQNSFQERTSLGPAFPSKLLLQL